MSDYYREMILENGFGMINCGDHLGVLISPRKHIARTPPGWVFLPSEDLTAETLNMAIEAAGKGRTEWPKKSSYEVPKPKQQKRRRRS